MDGVRDAAVGAKVGVDCPPLHPNCRSTTVADFDDMNMADFERRARDPATGELVTVSANMRYGDWYTTFIAKWEKGGILTQKSSIGGDGVTLVGRLDTEQYKVLGPLLTDEVVVTQRQLDHMQARHPEDFARFHSLIPDVVNDPDWIIEDTKNPNSYLLFRRFAFSEAGVENVLLQLVLRIHVTGDDPTFKNSVISMWEISERRLNNYLRNGKVLYKRE